MAMSRATPLLHGGAAWWSAETGTKALAYLVGSPPRPDEAESVVAETLANQHEPADDEWDPNWPDYKVAAMVHAGAQVGDEYVVGNGEGARATIQVVDVDGHLEARILGSRHYYNEIARACYEELKDRYVAGNEPSRPAPPVPAASVEAVLAEVRQLADGGPLDAKLLEVVRVRGCQIIENDSQVRAHTANARSLGETDERLAAIAEWRTSRLFTGPERAALAFIEAVVRCDPDGPFPYEVLKDLLAAFDPSERAALHAVAAEIAIQDHFGTSAANMAS